MAKDSVHVSPAGSFEGWRFGIWFSRNKENLKLLVMALAGLATYAITQYLPMGWQLGVSGVVAASSKLAVDAIDFRASRVVLE